MKNPNVLSETKRPAESSELVFFSKSRESPYQKICLMRFKGLWLVSHKLAPMGP